MAASFASVLLGSCLGAASARSHSVAASERRG